MGIHYFFLWSEKEMTPKLTKKSTCMPRGIILAPWHAFVCKIAKLWLPYCYEFATSSIWNFTSFTKFGMINCWVRYIFLVWIKKKWSSLTAIRMSFHGQYKVWAQLQKQYQLSCYHLYLCCRWWVCLIPKQWTCFTSLVLNTPLLTVQLTSCLTSTRPVEHRVMKIVIYIAQEMPSTTFLSSWKIWVHGSLNGVSMLMSRGPDITHRCSGNNHN